MRARRPRVGVEGIRVSPLVYIHGAGFLVAIVALASRVRFPAYGWTFGKVVFVAACWPIALCILVGWAAISLYAEGE